MTGPSGVAISDSERLARLRLSRSENVGPITYGQLLAHSGDAISAIEALPALAQRGGRRRPVKLCTVAQAESELAAIAALGGRLLTLGEPDYPEPLAAIEDAPPLLCLVGDAALFDRPTLAIVGARNASANGRRLAKQLAAELGEAGFAIASGMARGIDAAAHQGALESGTLAVMAGGPDVVYPQENQSIYEAIRERGLLLAELPPGTTPQARHFPRRNRIISGLSRGVVVVEAAPRSGSLITARLALEQGRELFAVPGSPLEPRARGCNALLRDGAAHLVESAEDVLRAFEGPFTTSAAAEIQGELRADDHTEAAPASVDGARDALLELLGAEPVLVDELLRQCHLSPAAIGTALLELELAGRVERHPGQRVALRMPVNGLAEAAKPL